MKLCEVIFFHQVSWGSDKKCGFSINGQFLNVSHFFYSDFKCYCHHQTKMHEDLSSRCDDSYCYLPIPTYVKTKQKLQKTMLKKHYIPFFCSVEETKMNKNKILVACDSRQKIWWQMSEILDLISFLSWLVLFQLRV